MTSVAAVAASHDGGDLLAAHDTFVDTLAISAVQRSARKKAARQFCTDHRDLAAWMRRPTPARLADLHRRHAWPFLSWLLVDGRLPADVELLVAKPGGCGLTETWCARHADDVAAVVDTAEQLGWSANWTRQVSRLSLPILCLRAGKPLGEVTDPDFDVFTAELDRSACISSSARDHTLRRLFALAEACYQLSLTARPRRRQGRVAHTPAELAEGIAQPAIRGDVIRYAHTLATTLKRSSVYARIKTIMVLCDWLAAHHPHVRRLDQLHRTHHIEPFLAWERHRPWRGANSGGRTISLTQFHHDIVDLRCFFDDLACWGWPSQPKQRLLFPSDIPRMPEPVPRALPPDVDRALMGAVAGLDEPIVRTALQLLRATGMRLGELLDLELDSVIDFGRHGPWLRVPLGKLETERMVPLDEPTVAVLDTWLANRGPQRPLPHPRDGRPADFLFCDAGRRLSDHRLRRGLDRASAAADLHHPDGRPRRITPHMLRHTYGTELINGGISLPALMALLGHVSPEMTLRYAKLANPTIRAAYQAAIDHTRIGRTLPIAPGSSPTTVPDHVEWLRTEMLKTRLAHGLCSRDPAAGACPYANICEQCDNFTPTSEFAAVMQAQLDDIRTLRHDAADRGWTDETARHDRTITSLEAHLRRINRPAPSPPPSSSAPEGR